ncbi:MAG: hypothetical protein AB7G21_00185 [Dehalococcoidia bacterium]
MNDHDDENPMWVARSALAAEADAADLSCRVALPASSMAALIGAGVPTDQVARFPTWDAPHTLLADDEALAEAVRSAGVPVARPVASYAMRQWDEREALEGAMHRFRDHDERPWGMSAYEPHTAVVLALGAGRARDVLGRLVEVAASGLVVDARVPRDLRVFALAALERGRVILVTAEGVEDARGDAATGLLARLV